MSRYCTSCGTPAAADDRFCAACGTRLQRTEPPPAASPEPAAPEPPVISGGSEAAGSGATTHGRPQRNDHTGPLVPDSPGSAESGGDRGRFSRNTIIAILAAVVLVLSGTVAALTLTRTSSQAAVTLQPVGTPGVNPFMPPVGTDQPGLRLVKGSGGTFSGGTPGLYGGTLRKASCNPQQMVGFLRAHPDKAAVWASVLGIQQADIPSYVADLTPVVLRSDTAVTNHGYTDGHVTSFPAVLQAGTAVLIDRYGRPVTKCFCGNPLTQLTAYARPAYAGKPWTSFSPASISIIKQSTVIINSFILVDPVTGSTFRRPPGSSGSADQPMAAVPAPAVESACQKKAAGTAVVGSTCFTIPQEYSQSIRESDMLTAGRYPPNCPNQDPCGSLVILAGNAYDDAFASGTTGNPDQRLGLKFGKPLDMNSFPLGPSCSSHLTASGTQPFGPKTAEYREWAVNCPDSSQQEAQLWRIAESRIIVLSEQPSTLGSTSVQTMVARASFINETPGVLSPPTQLSPQDGSVFNNYPRTATISWEAVPGATGYVIQIQACNPDGCDASTSSNGSNLPPYSQTVNGVSYYSQGFVGAQPGRWRVAALKPDGELGQFSPWWGFTYTQ
jgi:hypothetical protein